MILILFVSGCTTTGKEPPDQHTTDTNSDIPDNYLIFNVRSEQSFQNEIDIVSPELTGLPDLNINSDNLQAINNPRGDGVFVYVPQSEFYGVKRFFLWLVIDDNAYALNGAAKDLTPALKFPREADEGVWEKTGLDMYSATEAIEIVFTKKGVDKESLCNDIKAAPELKFNCVCIPLSDSELTPPDIKAKTSPLCRCSCDLGNGTIWTTDVRTDIEFVGQYEAA